MAYNVASRSCSTIRTDDYAVAELNSHNRGLKGEIGTGEIIGSRRRTPRLTSPVLR